MRLQAKCWIVPVEELHDIPRGDRLVGGVVDPHRFSFKHVQGLQVAPATLLVPYPLVDQCFQSFVGDDRRAHRGFCRGGNGVAIVEPFQDGGAFVGLRVLGNDRVSHA